MLVEAADVALSRRARTAAFAHVAAHPEALYTESCMAAGIASVVLYLVLVPVLLLFSAGTSRWPMAWVYAGINLVFIGGGRFLLLRRSPDLILERLRPLRAPGVKDWDRLLAALLALLGPGVCSVVAGLDRRYGWSPQIGLTAQIAAAVFVAAGYALGTWASLVNRFFSSVVRIQTERMHVVVSDGPYRLVRHPSYAGGCVLYLAQPVMLGTLWALLPSVLVCATLVLRTALEDRALRAELPGYAGYARRTRHRLVPGLW